MLMPMLTANLPSDNSCDADDADDTDGADDTGGARDSSSSPRRVPVISGTIVTRRG